MTKTVRKVRALAVDKRGRVIGIVGDAAHVLQLPGGTIKRHESPRSAVRREVAEETGRKVKVIGKVGTFVTRRNGTREITTLYTVAVSGRVSRTRPTGREARRGLRPARYASRRALLRALQDREARYGRSAVARDVRLVQAALQA